VCFTLTRVAAMQSTFKRFMLQLERSQHEEALRDVMAEAAADMGVASFAYLGLSSNPAPQLGPTLVSTYPTEWTDHYIGHDYCRIDPVIQTASQDVLPFYWGQTVPLKPLDEAQARLFREAQECGIHHGFTIPIHDAGRVASLNFCCAHDVDTFRKAVEEHRHVIHLMGIYFHAHVRRKLQLTSRLSRPCLTPREAECLQWSALGKSHQVIADILGLSRRTVKFHIENAMKKLDVATTRQAIVKATMLGVIEL
jgi:LuxR family transcriptional activator of conjugal transfer of Ti plasmids